MTFLHPSLLAGGVACIAIPILIHLLLRQRRKPVKWAAMRFLLEAFRRQRRRLRVQQWLLLAARCLLVLLVALAVGRPLLGAAGLLGAGAGRTVYILIDNSLASTVSESGSPGDSALTAHKSAALAMVDGLSSNDRAGLIALGAPAHAIVVPPSADLASIRSLIQNLEPTDGACDIAGAMEQVAEDASRQQQAGPSVVVAIFSEFLAGSADTTRPLPPALGDFMGTRIVASKPASRAPGNVLVMDVRPLRQVVLTGAGAGGGGASGAAGAAVAVSLRRTGASIAEAAATAVRMKMVTVGAQRPEGVADSTAVVRWQPGQSEGTTSVQVDPRLPDPAGGSGGVVLHVEIDRDAVTGDNVFRRPMAVREALRVGVVAHRRFGDLSPERLQPDQWLRLALRPTAGAPIDVVDIEPAALDAPMLASLDAVFAPAPDLLGEAEWQRLRRFVDSGGLLLVSPAPEVSVHLWSDEFVRALDLPWRLAREVQSYPEPGAGIDARKDGSTGGAGALLALVREELAELARPVRVWRTLPVEATDRGTHVLLKLADGTPWLVAAEPGAAAGEDVAGETEQGSAPGSSGSRGLVIYFASAPTLTWTDLPAKPFMVPLVHELVRQGVGLAAGSWTAIAGRPVSAPPRATRLRPVSASEGEPVEVAVASPGVAATPIRRAGVWQGLDEAGRSRGVVGVNADPDGGRTSAQDEGAVRAWLLGALAGDGSTPDPETVAWFEPERAGASLSLGPTGAPMSLPLLLGALAVAVLELCMARWFSHAVIARSGVDESGEPGGAAPLEAAA